MERSILHSDLNCFYASVEMLHHPELEGRPLAVGGDPEARHGIVLTANYIAKRSGVKTGMALWQAKEKCPEIVILPPRMDLYLRFSKMAREIYADYTDRIQSFGCDEAWLDVTDSIGVKGDGRRIAQEIRARIKYELGITVSIGLSWNKVFAKFGSDYKKPDAVTEITKENYKQIVWPRPVSELLMVGSSTNRKLVSLGIRTIGDIANAPSKLLEHQFGKMGIMLYAFAHGWDDSPVTEEEYQAPIKSIGNSTTTPRDLETNQDAKIILMALSESVSARLREHGFKCRTVAISIRDNRLFHFSRQMAVPEPTNSTDVIMETVYALFLANYHLPEQEADGGRDSEAGYDIPIRSLGVRATDLVLEDAPVQFDLFMDYKRKEKQEKMDQAVDEIRRRFGYFSIQRAFMSQDPALSNLDAKSSHTVHPIGYLKGP